MKLPPHFFSLQTSIPLFTLRRDSLRTRLMAWNMLTLALILALVGGLIQYTAQRSLLNSIDRDLQNGQPPFRALTGETFADLRAATLPPQGRHHDGGPHGPPERDGGDGPPPQTPPATPPAAPPALPNGPDAEPERGPSPSDPPNDASGSDENGEAQADAGDSGTRDRTVDWHRPRAFDARGVSLSANDSNAPASLAGFRAALTSGRAIYVDGAIDEEPARLLYTPLHFRGRVVAVRQAAHPMSEVYRALGVMRGALLTLIPAALLLAGLGGAWLTDRALRPVRQITYAAERIGADDLSRRLPTQGDDEFARLAATFNGMLGRLESDFAQRERLVRQQQEMILQQRRFTGDASHELRTPLTIIKANASLLLPAKPTEAEWREGVEEINAAADSMTRLTQDLLLLARSDGGQLARSMEILSAQDVLKKAVQRVQRADATPILLEPNAAPLVLRGDAEELTRLFCNLLENAQRHTPTSGTIRVEAARKGDQIVAQVSDNGVGIAPEHLPRLCERFYRVDSARSRPDGGTGLGLAICKSIAEAHGGSLSFASELGKGTTVTVSLPAESREEASGTERTRLGG